MYKVALTTKVIKFTNYGVSLIGFYKHFEANENEFLFERLCLDYKFSFCR